ADGSPAGAELTSRVVAAAAARGVLVTRCGPHTLRLCPALTIPRDDLKAGAQTLLEAVHDVFGRA
ncbi:MAG TPA: aspartate aminotransferase family protein, partial [Thermodesulfobacteriota bacterium]